MPVATVSKAEKEQAKRQSRATAKFERKSSQAASRLGFRMMSRSIAAFKRGDEAAVQEIIRKEFERVVPLMTDAMTIAYLVGLDRLRQPGSIQAATSVHSKAIEVLKKRLSISPDRIEELIKAEEAQAILMLGRTEAAIQKSLQRTMVNITKEGLARKEGVARLRDAFKRNGIVPANSFELEAVFRTQTNFAYSAGAWAAAQDPVVDEILWGYKYVTVGDDRVRDEHAALEGTTAPKDDAIWRSIWPPNGWACRCQILFIFKERKIEKPPSSIEVDGRVVIPGPDKGFDSNPGLILFPGGGSLRDAG